MRDYNPQIYKPHLFIVGNPNMPNISLIMKMRLLAHVTLYYHYFKESGTNAYIMGAFIQEYLNKKGDIETYVLVKYCQKFLYEENLIRSNMILGSGIMN